MIHLRSDVSIHKKAWTNAKICKSESLFSKNLARSIWDISKLTNRCLAEGVQKVSNRQSPRKLLTPEKVNIVEGIHFYIQLFFLVNFNKLSCQLLYY